jgi:hypothetical protein
MRPNIHLVLAAGSCCTRGGPVGQYPGVRARSGAAEASGAAAATGNSACTRVNSQPTHNDQEESSVFSLKTQNLTIEREPGGIFSYFSHFII